MLTDGRGKSAPGSRPAGRPAVESKAGPRLADTKSAAGPTSKSTGPRRPATPDEREKIRMQDAREKYLDSRAGKKGATAESGRGNGKTKGGDPNGKGRGEGNGNGNGDGHGNGNGDGHGDGHHDGHHDDYDDYHCYDSYWYGLGWCWWLYYPGYCSNFWWSSYWYYGGYWRYGYSPGYYYYGPFVPYASTVVYQVYDEDPEVIYVDGGAGGYVEEPIEGEGYVEGGELQPYPSQPVTPAKEGGDVPGLNRAADYYLTLGDRAFRDARYGDAVHFYAKAVEFSQEEAILYLILSDALFATGDYHYAAYALRKALDLDPNLATNVVDKHSFYTDGADFDRQLAVLERYLEDHFLDDDARLVLAANYLFGGRPASAVDLLKSPFSKTVSATAAGALLLESAEAIQYGEPAGAGR